MAAKNDNETASTRRRRRSVGKAKPAPVGPLGWARTPWFGGGLLIAMSLLAAAYTWQTWVSLKQASEALGPVALGMSESEVRAALSPAGATAGAAGELLFNQDGRQFAVQLSGPDQRVVGVSCHEQVVTSPACPAIIGIRIGDSSAEVKGAIGAGRLLRDGRGERLDYAQIGAVFYLQEGRVVRVAVRAGPTGERMAEMLLWRLIP